MINSDAPYTRTTAVTLNLAAVDLESGIDKMRFSNDGIFDETVWTENWHAYAPTMNWTIGSNNGVRKVWVQFKDKAGNVSAGEISDTIFLDVVNPLTKLSSPSFSTNGSNTTAFTVSWSATEVLPSSGLKSYDVQYSVGSGGTWANWQPMTSLRSAVFKGTAGKTYFFRARAEDNAGNVGNWSATDWTVIPWNQEAMTFSSGWSRLARSNLYLGTSKYSPKAGATAIKIFSGAKGIALIVTKRPRGGYARVYIDNVFVKKISLYSPTTKYRRSIPIKSSATAFSGTLKVVVAGAHESGSGGNRVELDGSGQEVSGGRLFDGDASHALIDRNIHPVLPLGARGIHVIPPLPPQVFGLKIADALLKINPDREI